MEPVQSGETMISRVQPGMLPPEAWMDFGFEPTRGVELSCR